MAHPLPDPPATLNRLLAALPAPELARIWPRFERVETRSRDVLISAGSPIATAWFPETGWASMIAILLDGRSAEVGLTGREGMLGLQLLLGDEGEAMISPLECLVQAPGTMLRIEAGAFRRLVEDCPALRQLGLRFAFAQQQQVTQTAACNGHHTLDQRLARWLLMAHDRAEGDVFPMTQEFLALMLCVRRPGVTVAARLFQRAGLIRYSQGQMEITDRPGLESASCECYAAARGGFERLLGTEMG